MTSYLVTGYEYFRTIAWIPFVLALLAGAGFGYSHGGRLAYIRLPRLAVILAFIALAAQLTLARISSIEVFITLVAYMVTYLLAGICLVLIWRELRHSDARRLGGIALAMLTVGWFLNMTVIALNSGIPVSQRAVEIVGLENEDESRELFAKHPHGDHHTGEPLLGFLGDVIPVPFPIRGVFSVGDAVFIVGLAGVVAASMLVRPSSTHPPTEQSRA